jgi:hypothetical protein
VVVAVELAAVVLLVLLLVLVVMTLVLMLLAALIFVLKTTSCYQGWSENIRCDITDGGVISGSGDAGGDYPSDGGGNIDCIVGSGGENMTVTVMEILKRIKYNV